MTAGFCVMNLRSEELRSKDPFWSKNVDISKTRTWTFSSEMLNEQRILLRMGFIEKMESFLERWIFCELSSFFFESWDFFFEKIDLF